MRRWIAAAAVVVAGTAGAVIGPVGLPPASAAAAYLSTNFQGALASSPDAALASGDHEASIVTRGTDGFIYLERLVGGSVWNSWQFLNAPPVGAVGDPAAVSWGPGRLDVFVRGGDGKLWQTYRPTATSFFSPWINPVFDGNLASGPEVSSRGPGQLDVFVLGTDGSVYQRTYDGNWNIGWIGLGKPATVGLTGEPSSASPVFGSNRVELYAQGTDQKLWSRSWDGAAWGPWRQPAGNDGVLASPPEAVSAAGSVTTVLVRGTDDQLYVHDFGAGSSPIGPWQRESDGANPIRGTPSAYAVTFPAPAHVTAVVRGVDDKAYTQDYLPAIG